MSGDLLTLRLLVVSSSLAAGELWRASAALASVPIANLLTPLFATAFMVHIYKRLARRAGLARAAAPMASRG